MSRKHKIKIFKIILLIIVATILLGLIIYLFPVMKDLSTVEGQIAFKDKVSASGIIGILTLFGLQVAQIFLIIVPGEPIEILAGMCYGSIGGTIFIMISACIISTTIFFLVRKFGRKFVYDFCDREKVRKIENHKLFQNPKKIEMIMFILFLIPGTPKDLLVYIAGLLPIKPLKFVVISTFARFPSVISSTLAGENLAVGDWKMGLILYAIIFVLVGIVKLAQNKFTESQREKIKLVRILRLSDLFFRFIPILIQEKILL